MALPLPGATQTLSAPSPASDAAQDWRAVARQDVLPAMAKMANHFRNNGNAGLADRILVFGEGMRAARVRGEPFYVQERSSSPGAGPTDATPASDLTVPVYVITPGRCASACLNAVDTFTRFTNVRLIGAPTPGDSTYMEVRATDLPSGHGTIVIPNKIWVGRPRRRGLHAEHPDDRSRLVDRRFPRPHRARSGSPPLDRR